MIARMDGSIGNVTWVLSNEGMRMVKSVVGFVEALRPGKDLVVGLAATRERSCRGSGWRRFASAGVNNNKSLPSTTMGVHRAVLDHPHLHIRWK
jgi:hypothetical protein